VTQVPSVVTREAGTSQPTGRTVRRRLSASHLLVALAVVLAFVLNILALQDRSASTLAVVADRPIAAGTALTAELVRLAPIPADFEGLGSILVDESLDGYLGWLVERSVPEGGVIASSILGEPATSSGLRMMSLPTEVARSAGGTIGVGDRVDVITVVDGQASYVVAGVEVVGVSGPDGAGLGAVEHHVVVAVDADQALALAEAVALGPIDVIRSTGAPPAASGVDGD
jgi:Flp pilus assembly protein CpaB